MPDLNPILSKLVSKLSQLTTRSLPPPPSIPTFLETIAIPLRSTAHFEVSDYATRPGEYLLYISAQLAPADHISISLSLTPDPTRTPIPFAVYSISSGSLFSLRIPPCAGFSISFDSQSARPVSPFLHVWLISHATALPREVNNA